MTTKPEPHATVEMTEREHAFYLAGRAIGQAEAYAEAAKHLAAGAKQAGVQQWAQQMGTWMQALAKDVGSLERVVGKTKTSGKKLAQAIAGAVPNLGQPQQAFEAYLGGTASAFSAKAEQCRGQFAAALASAQQATGNGAPKGLVRRLVGNLAAELAKL